MGHPRVTKSWVVAARVPWPSPQDHRIKRVSDLQLY
jgi:Rad3-related DNA helicase